MAISSQVNIYLPTFREKEGHKAQQCNISIALNHIEHTLISTLSNINLDDIYQDIIKHYNLEDIAQWIVLNSKTL